MALGVPILKHFRVVLHNSAVNTRVRLFKTKNIVNFSLKFQRAIPEICQYFLLKNVRSFCSAKASLIFSTKKKISVYSYKVLKVDLLTSSLS